MMNDDMRGLFFVVKGQYKKGVEPSFSNRVSGDTSFIGGYDPYSDDTEEWYMVLDNKTFHCIACGSSLNKVLRSVRSAIVKHKGVAKNYFKHVSEITSDDYYETHYLGRTPLTPDQRLKKAEGRCPRVSPVMRELYTHIYSEFGDYYSEEVREMEDLAYSDLVEERPLNKTRKLMSKYQKNFKEVEIETPKEEKVLETQTLKKSVRPKVRLGIKKLV